MSDPPQSIMWFGVAICLAMVNLIWFVSDLFMVGNLHVLFLARFLKILYDLLLSMTSPTATDDVTTTASSWHNCLIKHPVPVVKCYSSWTHIGYDWVGRLSCLHWVVRHSNFEPYPNRFVKWIVFASISEMAHLYDLLLSMTSPTDDVITTASSWHNCLIKHSVQMWNGTTS